MSRDDGKDGHRQRLRTQFMEDSTRVREDQVLEMHLYNVFKRGDTSPLAKRLIKRFTSFRGFMDALASERLSVEGYGPSCEQYFQLLRESMARYAEGAIRLRPDMNSFEAVAEMACARLSGCRREEVWVALLNSKNHLLDWQRLSTGTVNKATIFPREVVQLAFDKNATGIILVHNHPGGESSPSDPDIELTLAIKRLGKSLGVRVLDHLVVADGQCRSMNIDGLLD